MKRFLPYLSCLLISCHFSFSQVITQDSLALVDFYNATDGDNWTDTTGWLRGPVSTWHGVLTNSGRVIRLVLPNNNLTGTLPESLGDLTSLGRIQLDTNAITGNIPESIGNITGLNYLELNDNSLTGAIPESIAELTSMLYLDLYNNQLTGDIPDSLGNLANLIRLDLSNNNIEGDIPDGITDFVNLSHLDLSDNNLTGTIPDSIGNLINLGILDLSNNELSGSIPSSIGNLTDYLARVYLNDNNLSGDVPASLANLISWLYELDLGDNNLTGLPDLSGLSGLNLLNVNNNAFTFEDLEPNVSIIDSISPQDNISGDQSFIETTGSSITFDATTGGTSNMYQWYKNDTLIPAETSSMLTFSSLTLGDSGVYDCRVTNGIVTNLTLSTGTFTLQMLAAPTLSIGSPSATLASAGPVTYTLTYAGADSITLAADDLTLNASGDATGDIAVSGDGLTSRTVTISNITGDGTLGFTVADSTASDDIGNMVAGTTSGTFTVDNTAPVGYGVSIDQAAVNGSNQNNASFTFSNAEVGATYEYSFTSDGGGTGVTGNGAVSTATDQVSGIDLSGLNDGSVVLSVILTDGIGNEGTAVADTVTKDVVSPTVLSIVGQDTNPIPSGTTSATYLVTFSESVTGIDTSDFALVVSDLTADVASVSASSGSSVVVTIDNISGVGTFQLTLEDDDSMVDASGNPLGGEGVDNGDFAGDTYRTSDVVNTVPNVLLADTLVDENLAVGSLVGILSTDDQDAGDTHTYTLVSGTGDDGNGFFSISGDSLLTGSIFNHESNSSFSVRIQVDDGNGGTAAEAFTISVSDVNEAPSNLALSNTSINENEDSGALAGIFTLSDEDEGDSHVYSLITGEGDTDNGTFTVSGDSLFANASFDFETKSSYNIRVGATDNGGLTIAMALTIDVNDVNENPSSLTLSNASVEENQDAGTTIGVFNVADEDDTVHTYSLVTGIGDTNNDLFTIDGDVLRTGTAFDYESDNTYSVRVRAMDDGGLFTEQFFSISIIDVSEESNSTPTDITLSNSSLAENQPAGTVVGTFSAIDADTADTHSYALVSGTGSDDNDAFTINGDQLLTMVSFDYETKNDYSIRVQGSDGNGGFLDRIFQIDITNVGEPAMEVSITSLDFSTIDVNSSDTMSFEIANTGDTALVIAITYPSSFAGDFDAGTIAVDSSQQVVVTFSPDQVGFHAGVISIASNGEDAFVVVTGESAAVTGVEDNVSSVHMDIYPNPASKRIEVIAEKPIKKVDIYDAAGHAHSLKGMEVDRARQRLSFTIGHLKNGLYVLAVGTVDGNTQFKKLLIN